MRVGGADETAGTEWALERKKDHFACKGCFLAISLSVRMCVCACVRGCVQISCPSVALCPTSGLCFSNRCFHQRASWNWVWTIRALIWESHKLKLDSTVWVVSVCDMSMLLNKLYNFINSDSYMFALWCCKLFYLFILISMMFITYSRTIIIFAHKSMTDPNQLG